MMRLWCIHDGNCDNYLSHAILAIHAIQKVKIMSSVLPIRLSDDLNERLNRLASETGRTKTYYARQAIVTYLEDIEDTYLALKRLETPGRYLTTEELKRELDLED